jgi:hypothetical protein
VLGLCVCCVFVVISWRDSNALKLVERHIPS